MPTVVHLHGGVVPPQDDGYPVDYLGAPYVERLRGNHTLTAALTGITAAVVGVIAHLGLYLALHTLFATTHTLTTGPLHLLLPNLDTLQPAALAITVIAAVLTFRLQWPLPRILGISTLARTRRRSVRTTRHIIGSHSNNAGRPFTPADTR